MAATNFPFTITPLTGLKNASGNLPRFNFKNDGNYNIASQVSTGNGPWIMQGYGSSVGDGGKATIDGGANAIVMFLVGTGLAFSDLIFQNNGATGSNSAININNSGNLFMRCVCNNIRGTGFDSSANTNNMFVECEAYACNKSNTSALAGFAGSSSCSYFYCVSHDNGGSNTDGFTFTPGSTGNILSNCISETNGRHGYSATFSSSNAILQCDAYNNAGDGLKNLSTTTNGICTIRNCNFIKNTGWGINSALTTGRWFGFVDNCGFGSGTQANGSGTTNATDALIISNSVTYASDVTPWVDPANGDFRINLTAAKNSGRGSFTETQASYSGTIGYPDIGAAQHLDSGGTATQKAYTFCG